MVTPFAASGPGSAEQFVDEKEVSPQATSLGRHELGQFFTPTHVADLMASFFHAGWSELELLDAGAGSGELTAALVRRLCGTDHKPKRILVTAYEFDVNLIGSLNVTLQNCQEQCERAGIHFSARVFNEDFISSAVSVLRGGLFSPRPQLFHAAIVNPPYRKLRSDSSARLWLRSIGIETSNFYTAFVALIVRLLSDRGELVAITPRSFCNGPYFKPFRRELLKTISIQRLHLFDSRSAAFGKDNVLQENLILHGVKGEPQQADVILSSSSGGPTSHVSYSSVPFSDVVLPTDGEQFIHCGADHAYEQTKPAVSSLKATLGDLGLTVSTGRVVDFRARAFLRSQPSSDTAPLIYPCHFNGSSVVWPKDNSRKPNAILIHERTRDLLIPSEVYVLVKRFSSKEERRRIVACIYDPRQTSVAWVAFENHLNYFHNQGRGLPMPLATGLAAFLNSTVIDSYFRQFSGHTQVNATDLRKLNYPTTSALERLGRRIKKAMSQNELDDIVEKELFQWELRDVAL